VSCCLSAGAHVIVVATSGVGMGLAALRAAERGLIASVTIVKRDFGFDAPDLNVAPHERVVVLDNSMHTGETAMLVLDALRKQGISVESIITLIGSKNACEERIRDQVRSATGVAVLACAEWADRHRWLAPRSSSDDATTLRGR
jgi:orotate phosphoribosyltransferase